MREETPNKGQGHAGFSEEPVDSCECSVLSHARVWPHEYNKNLSLDLRLLPV